MQNVISIAGATGNLGGRIASALRKRGAAVRALVRPGTAPERLSKLRQQQIEIVEVDLTSPTRWRTPSKAVPVSCPRCLVWNRP